MAAAFAATKRGGAATGSAPAPAPAPSAISVSLAKTDGADVLAAAVSPFVEGGGIGFAARPYFYQPDATRLAASITNSEPQAIGSTSNSWGVPLAFISVCNSHLATPSSWTDMRDCEMAVGGWLTNNSAMRAVAKSFCLAKVRRADPAPGEPIDGDEYQHIEDQVNETTLVVDLCYADFTSGERTEVADWINRVLDYAETEKNAFWPVGNQPHNNYWQNHLLALCVAGLSGEGWNPRAAEWRTKFETWAAIAVAQYTAPTYVGPQVTEGRYYGSYTMNQLWAMRMYDAVMGTTFGAQCTVNADNQLELGLFQMSTNNFHGFNIGSEANDVTGRLASTHSALWHYCMYNAGATVNAQTAKAIYTSSTSGIVSDSSANFYARYLKALWNFLWPLGATTAGALTAKTERRLVLPSPGGAQTYLRSSAGWDLTGSARAAVMFASPSGDPAPYSHANPDAPGFQWCHRGGTAPANPTAFIVVDPEYRDGGGVYAEAGYAGAWATNAVIPGSLSTLPAASVYPVKLFDEDNMGAAVPHYYFSVNAQPYWSTTSTYRRQYVWLDDLQVVLVHDRVVGGGSKLWQMHTDGTVSVAGAVATITTRVGSYTARAIDLFSTSSAAFTVTNLVGTNSVGSAVYRISQTDTAADYRSLKLLDVGGRVTAYALSSGAGYLQADITFGGVARAVRFFDDGSHATVS